MLYRLTKFKLHPLALDNSQVLVFYVRVVLVHQVRQIAHHKSFVQLVSSYVLVITLVDLLHHSAQLLQLKMKRFLFYQMIPPLHVLQLNSVVLPPALVFKTYSYVQLKSLVQQLLQFYVLTDLVKLPLRNVLFHQPALQNISNVRPPLNVLPRQINALQRLPVQKMLQFAAVLQGNVLMTFPNVQQSLIVQMRYHTDAQVVTVVVHCLIAVQRLVVLLLNQ